MTLTETPTKTTEPESRTAIPESKGKRPRRGVRAIVKGEEISLTADQVEAFGAELDAIRERVIAERGERDVNYMKRVIKVQRGLEVGGRGLLWFGWLPPAWIAGTAALSLSKILDNMEIGHNVMHGQFDWTNDPKLSSKGFEWDTACPGDQWRHSHNYMHHTHTNIVGKDRDIGYGVLRMSEDEPWSPYYLGNPVYATLLATFFQYGVAMHDLEFERIANGETTLKEKREMLARIWKKVRRQSLKDYVLFPALSGPGFPFTLAGNATANLIRNLWAFTIIFCGHFPDGTQEFTEEETADESRGAVVLPPDPRLGQPGGQQALPHPLRATSATRSSTTCSRTCRPTATRELSDEVREICERYGIPYNIGPLGKQFGSVVRKICRLALPDRPSPDAEAVAG